MSDSPTTAHTRLELPIDIIRIQALLPHRYPFLLVDRILELDQKQKRIVAQKNVSINEPFFQGHFLNIQSCQAFLSLKHLRKPAA